MPLSQTAKKDTNSNINGVQIHFEVLKEDIKYVKIFSSVRKARRHFLILKLKCDKTNARVLTDILSRQVTLSNTYLFQENENVFYIFSFCYMCWYRYKTFLFKFTERNFKHDTLENKCGCVSFETIRKGEKDSYIGNIVMKTKHRRNEDNVLKNTVFQLLDYKEMEE